MTEQGRRPTPGAGPPNGDAPALDLRANEGHLNRLDRLGLAPAALVVVFSAAVYVIVFAVDIATGPDLQLLIFYLVPVLVMAWRFDLFVGELTAGLVVIAGGVANVIGPDPVSELTAIWNSSARFVFLSLMVALVNRQRAVLDHQRALASTDPLTGVLNRRAFHRVCADELARARRQPAPLALLYFDMNGLKTVNDREGHDAGDRMLVDLARTVNEVIRTTDTFARMGGDEFAVLLPDTGLEEARSLADRLRQTLATLRPRPLAVSMGIVATHEVPATVESLVHRADQLMYEAKRADGGTRSALLDPVADL